MSDHVGQELGDYGLQPLPGHGGFAEVYLEENSYLNFKEKMTRDDTDRASTEPEFPSLPNFAAYANDILRKPLIDTVAQVDSLLSWGENWNSYRTLAPDRNAIEYAKNWIVVLFQVVEDLRLPWIQPSVTASPEGEVVFEWWYKEKKLTVYVGDQSIDYVQVWGIDINAKITDGDIESIGDCRLVWKWLTS